VIRVRDLLVRFGETTALSLAALDVGEGECVGVHGRNGSGKSTLLRVLGGLQTPSAGTVEGAPPPGRAVLVHQIPWLFRGTAAENAALALRAAGVRRRERRRRVLEALARFGAQAYADRPASALSGGERRRVALARASLADPALWLLDEPLSDLDAAGRAAVAEALLASKATRVIASPDPIPALCPRWVALTGASAGAAPS
jgi:ABC-type multidrug transport system ATPase subunit